MPYIGASAAAALGALADECAAEKNLVDVFTRLSQKKGKKASTRANARQVAAAHQKLYNQCLARVRASEVEPHAPPPGTIVVQHPPTTGGPGYEVAQIPQQPYSTSEHAGPYISPSIPPEWLQAIQTAAPTDYAEGIPAGATQPQPGAPVAGVLDECDPAFGQNLPLTYNDQFGPMTVLQVFCP